MIYVPYWKVLSRTNNDIYRTIVCTILQCYVPCMLTMLCTAHRIICSVYYNVITLLVMLCTVLTMLCTALTTLCTVLKMLCTPLECYVPMLCTKLTCLRTQVQVHRHRTVYALELMEVFPKIWFVKKTEWMFNFLDILQKY